MWVGKGTLSKSGRNLLKDKLQLKVVAVWVDRCPSIASCLGGLRNVETHLVCRGGGGRLNCYK